jgi:Cdc6-like AAA superfamily ATPase
MSSQDSSSAQDSSDSSYATSSSEEVDDDVLITPKKTTPYLSYTPKAPRYATPITPRKRQHVAVTPLPDRSTPRKQATTNLARARERLHTSAAPESLPCRHTEFAEVLAHVENALFESIGCCLYISGVPGTGKTATVHAVMNNLNRKRASGDVPPYKFVEINGMKCTEPAHAYVALWEALSGHRLSSKHAAESLESLYGKKRKRGRHSLSNTPCVVLMDELDVLVTKKQHVLYNFFDWPNRPASKLIVIAVANTMDLPERMLSAKVSSRLGLTRINFSPYTHHQLQDIIASRLRESQAFDLDAIELCARKVSAVSGDARRALDICRLAVEMVQADARKRQTERENASPLSDISQSRRSNSETRSERSSSFNHSENPLAVNVSVDIINRTVREMFAAPAVVFTRNASMHQKLFLVALVHRLRKSGTGETMYGPLCEQHAQLCKLHQIQVPSSDEFSVLLNSLSESMILLELKGNGPWRRIVLNVSEEDVIMGLRDDAFFKSMLP